MRDSILLGIHSRETQRHVCAVASLGAFGGDTKCKIKRCRFYFRRVSKFYLEFYVPCKVQKTRLLRVRMRTRRKIREIMHKIVNKILEYRYARGIREIINRIPVSKFVANYRPCKSGFNGG